jgi:AraC-like DNA-binding protein
MPPKAAVGTNVGPVLIYGGNRVIFTSKPESPRIVMNYLVAEKYNADYISLPAQEIIDFFEKPEMYAIKQLLASSERGLDLSSSHSLKTIIINDLIALEASSGFEGILKLLSILQKLSTCTDYQFIASVNYENTYKISETERMRLVHEYVLKHYKEKISLSAVAALANMTEAAFCRYFKTRANKTFSEFVREIRIGHACKLLLAGKMSIAQVGYESGFNTVSNFNSQFKAMKGKSPKQYQKIYIRD